VVGDAVVVQGTVSGSNVTATSIRDGVVAGEARNGMGINGTVASISGTTLTVTGNVGPKGGTATTYTVDASGASVVKNGTASTVSVIIVGDKVMVQGTVTGTNVIAKNIRDGVPQPQIQGNGQPIVAGKVTAISGSTITITNTSNVTYTIDATSAKFVVGGVASPTISNIAVGNNVVVQGTVNGNSVIASSIIDQKAKTTVGEVSPGSPKSEKGMGGFMKGVGDFFKHMFGF
jgi:hypothetical protein